MSGSSNIDVSGSDGSVASDSHGRATDGPEDRSEQTASVETPASPADRSEQTASVETPASPTDRSEQTASVETPASPADRSEQTASVETPASPDAPRLADRPAARRRLGMVALLYAYRAAAALVVATPAALLAGGVSGGDPRGDAILFEPGGMMFLEAARLTRAAILPVAAQGGLVVLVASLVGLLPLAALIAALGHEGRLSARFLAGRAAASVGTLSLLWGVALLAQVVVAALVVLLGGKVVSAAGLDTRGEDLAHLGVAGLALAVAAAVGIVHDLARVVAVLEGRGFYMASARAVRAVAAGGAWVRALWAYAWRGALSLGAVLGALWASTRLGVGDARSFALTAVTGQAAVLAAVFLRASWLAAGIRIVGREAPSSAADIRLESYEAHATGEPVESAVGAAERDELATIASTPAAVADEPGAVADEPGAVADEPGEAATEPDEVASASAMETTEAVTIAASPPVEPSEKAAEPGATGGHSA